MDGEATPYVSPEPEFPPVAEDQFDERSGADRRQGPHDRRRESAREYFSWRGGRGYRDIWLLFITLLALGAVRANSHRVSDIANSRVGQTLYSCGKSNDAARSLNALDDALQGIVLAGAALPGDTPSPVSKGAINPRLWRTLKPGPLSLSLEHQFPQLPTAQQRLDNARANADVLRGKKVRLRDCQAEARNIAKVSGAPTPRPR